jgi:hypothetical protein
MELSPKITTRGLRRALARHPAVESVTLFAPFAYEALHDRAWDLVSSIPFVPQAHFVMKHFPCPAQVVIEGWMGTVRRFIHQVRGINPAVKVLYFCLDTYPDLDTVLALDVDGFLTNSWALLPRLVSTLGGSALVP